MALAAADIEWVVREVIRRLRNTNDLPADNSNEESTSQTQPDTDSLELNQPVITLTTLDSRLNGIHRVVVSRRAVVTPAVVDALRDRKIELVRRGQIRDDRANGTTPAPATGPLVVVIDQAVDIPQLTRSLPGVDVVQDSSLDNKELCEKLNYHIASGNRAVLLTNAPAAAVVALNRDMAIRAALGFNFPGVRQAVDEAGANVLAIDPSGKGTSQLAGMINEFLKRT